MPTKKILLRGISRTPSDRMSADGGLAESIGFENDMQELAVNVPATDVTRDIVGNDVSLDDVNLKDAEVVFIHKTNDYTNYIAKNGTGVGLLDNASPYYHAFYTFEIGETLKEIKSIGNTLILLTANSQGETQRMEYVLFKNGNYIDLGDQVPTPDIEVVQTVVDLEDDDYEDCKTKLEALWPISTEECHTNFELFRILCGYDPLEPVMPPVTEEDMKYWDESLTNYFNHLLNQIVESIYTDVTKHNLDNQTLSEPVFIRYGVRMYDGYVKQSAPILIDPNLFTDAELKQTIRFRFTKLTDEPSDSLLTFRFVGVSDYNTKHTRPYRLSFNIKNASEFENWKDIVSGVDIFASDLIDRARMKVLQIDEFDNDVQSQLDNWDNVYDVHSTFHLKPYTDKEMLEMISSHSIFYQIKKIEIDDYLNASAPLEIDDYKIFYGENLVTLPTLPDDLVNSTHHTTVPSAIKVYNSRLMASGTKVKYMSGYPEPSSRKYDSGYSGTKWTVRYYIKAGGWQSGSEIVVSKEYDMEPGPWLYYPDSNCYKADVIRLTSGLYYKLTVEMFEDIHLNGACGFLGWGADMTAGELYTYENIDKPFRSRINTLMQTDAFNPFVFTAEKEFTGNIVDIAVITKPLSTGQFGYSSLYVFTDEGLWALGINNDGSLAATDAISQDAALPGTVCQLDQAVVFTTKKGVMLLSGSDLRCISDRMHGRHYKLDAVVHSLLAGVGSQFKDDWGDLADMAYEDLPFMDYMQDARTAYDYVGRRLLFFSVADNPQPYIYTYMIETDSWHKVVMPAGYEFRRVLNSYPDTFIAMDRIVSTTVEQVTTIDKYAAMLCFSNARSQSDATRYKAMLVTRPMDLDEDDVRKVMNRLFIRGSYPKTFQKSAQVEDRPVKMVLMGSVDGETWQMLRSFRGGSYKLFRLVLLCQLTQAERISYVEAEYESRYTNRLR